jgi:hypothetical protein
VDVQVPGVLIVAGERHDACGPGVQFEVTGNSLNDLEQAPADLLVVDLERGE